MINAETNCAVISGPSKHRSWRSRHSWQKQVEATLEICCFIESSSSSNTLRSH